jgi:hypothetical protein
MHVYSAVFAHVYVFCTYFVRIFVHKAVGASILESLGIRQHTCIYVHILQQMRADTCNIHAISCKKNKEPVLCIYYFSDRICMYMHVHVCIYKKIVYIQTYTNQDRICMYMYVMYVYARISTYIVSSTSLLVPILGEIVYERMCTYMYMLVYVCICMYMHVYARMSTFFLEWPPAMREPMPLPQNIVSLRAAASRPHSGLPGPSDHSLFLAISNTFADSIWRSYPLPHASRAPDAPLQFHREAPPALSAFVDPVSWPITGDLVGLTPPSSLGASAATP